MHHRRVVIWSVQVVGALFLEVVSRSCQNKEKGLKVYINFCRSEKELKVGNAAYLG